MEIALYVRVSTTRQQHTQTIAQQVARLREYVAMQPDWHLAEEHIYRDDGYSGAKLQRPGLDRLRDRAALAAFEQVLITAPDRLARTLRASTAPDRRTQSARLPRRVAGSSDESRPA